MMKKTIAASWIFLLFVPAFAEIGSLSQLFSPGRSLLDLDGDGLGEKLTVSIIIPDNPTACELALAADIAARANFESLRVEFGLVVRESEVEDWAGLTSPILIGHSLRLAGEILNEHKIRPSSLGSNQGLVMAFTHRGRRGILCVAGSDESLLRTGRAYFLRWPYFWEIWGRETGATFHTLEEDLSKFLSDVKIDLQKTVIREALYEFPLKPSGSNALRSLEFDEGQIKDLTAEVHFLDKDDRDKARAALDLLRLDHRKGHRTGMLTYPGCARLTIELWHDRTQAGISLPRVGSTKRLLTPGFRPRPPNESAGKEFDITGLFKMTGFYSDQNRDGIADGLDSVIIISGDRTAANVVDLASRLILDTAGGSFPITYLDSEVESRKSLAAPVLVGRNELTRQLIRTGRLKPRDLEPGQGWIWTVPEAFGKSSALVIDGADSIGLEKTISYFSRTFPYFNGFGEGRPQLRDLLADIAGLLEGEKGGAEAYLTSGLREALKEMEGKDLESVEAEVLLPRPNRAFEEHVGKKIREAAPDAQVKVSGFSMKAGRTVFEREKRFIWEVDDALGFIENFIAGMKNTPKGTSPLRISLGISESPRIRETTRFRIEGLLREAGFPSFEVEVLSAYKPGFFWLKESVIPRLKGKGAGRIAIRFAEEKADLTRAKRSYAEPARWLQELYPVDEIISRELAISLDKVEFEIGDAAGPTYEVVAFDNNDRVLMRNTFSPRLREISFLDILPEWGTVTVTTGWLRAEWNNSVIVDQALQTDLERFWAFYQDDILRPLHAHILKKTGQEPTFSKQPYFKKLAVEVRLSEPDYRLGLDEEIISSLEALHDEIYFDTLDFLRGVTRFDPEDKDLPQDASRSSAPGNVTPLIYPSLEGGPGSAKVVLEDWPGVSPHIVMNLREKGRDEVSKKITFPKLKPERLRVPGLVYNGREERVKELILELEWAKESDYDTLLDILESHRTLSSEDLVSDPFRYPRLDQITVRLRFKNRDKDEMLTVSRSGPEKVIKKVSPNSDGSIVTTREIISPSMCLDIVDRLGGLSGIRSFTGGRSFEGREVPVIEMSLPLESYVSLPRLITFKPTIQLTGRQHANEVSSTNYLLKFAELVAKNEDYRDVLKKMNIVLQPMENPDGAALAYELHKIEPFHSLHAGRYGSLGVDIGYQGSGTRPLLPEAEVRTNLYNRWLPDIFLNLHGYPSHEWVQPFSNYTPYLFRDYWIPKGWFTYYRTLSLPIYEKSKKAGEELMGFIIRELQADQGITESNKKFYERYERWAGRWAPHMNVLEVYDGVMIYVKRRSSSENKLSRRTETTFVEQTPELMDETATGEWLDFLCRQGLAYLRGHVKYLEQVKFDVVRLEEEAGKRVRISFLRGRPGSVESGRGPS